MATKPKNWNRISVRSKSEWFAGGRVSVGKVTAYNRRETREFTDWYVGKVRGLIVTDPATGCWKHATAAEAKTAAQHWLARCKREAEG